MSLAQLLYRVAACAGLALSLLLAPVAAQGADTTMQTLLGSQGDALAAPVPPHDPAGTRHARRLRPARDARVPGSLGGQRRGPARRRFRPGPGRAARRGGSAVTALLETSGVSRTFDGLHAINDLPFTVNDRELRAVIGPSGVGRTTFIGLVTGRTRPDAGTIRCGELSRSLVGMSKARIAQAGVGRKFWKPTVFEGQTVAENLALALRSARGALAVLIRRAAPDIEAEPRRIGPLDDLDRRAGDLSHGQEQWLELGMLLAQKARPLLIDEPGAGMTLAEREKITAVLVEAAQKRAVVVIEHDMEFVRRLECRVTVPHEGGCWPKARPTTSAPTGGSSTSIRGGRRRMPEPLFRARCMNFDSSRSRILHGIDLDAPVGALICVTVPDIGCRPASALRSKVLPARSSPAPACCSSTSRPRGSSPASSIRSAPSSPACATGAA